MDFSLLLMGASLHWGEPEWNEGVSKYQGFNPGIGMMLHEGPVYAAVGTYNNSIDCRSNFAALGLVGEISPHFGITAGVSRLTGYINEPPVVPLVTIYGQYKNVRIHAILLEEAVGFMGEIKL